MTARERAYEVARHWVVSPGDCPPSEHAAQLIACAGDIEAAILAAEREAAEAMREAAAGLCDAAEATFAAAYEKARDSFSEGARDAVDLAATAIRALPLPGDVPVKP